MEDTAKTRSLRPDAAINTARVSLLRLARQIEHADLTDTKQVAALRASIDQASDAFRIAVAVPGFDPSRQEGAQELMQALARALDPLRDLVRRLSEHAHSGGQLMTLTGTGLQHGLTRLLTPTALSGSGVPIEGARGAGAFLPIDEAVSIVTQAYGTLQVVTEKLKVTGRELSADGEVALFRVILAIERSGLVTSIDAGIFDFLPEHLAKAVTRDHHGIHRSSDRPEVSTTMLVLDEIERIRARNLPAEEKIALLEHEYRYCVTDNLGDAILALVMARHIPELITKGGIELDMKARTRVLLSFDMLRRLAHFEDFGFFGSGNVGEGRKRSAPGEVVLRDLIHLVLGNFQVFDELLVKFGVKGSDRFDGLRPKAQIEIVEAAARGVEENLESYATRLERAQRFKASIDQLKREVSASHDEMRRYLEAHGIPASDMAELDSKVFYFFGTMTGGCFARWDAPALTHKRKIQWQSIRFDTHDGHAKWGFVLAVPSGRTPSFLDTSLVRAFGPRLPNAIARGDTLLFVLKGDDGHGPPEAMARILVEELRNHETKEPPVETAAAASFPSLVGENVISHDAYMYDDQGRYTWTPEAYEASKAMAEEAFEVAVKNPACKDVVLIVGLPGAGKSTYVRAHNAPDTVYFDSTLTTPEKRRPLISVAREAHKPISIVWIDTPLEACLARNRLRTDRDIPEVWMQARQAELDAEPPDVKEGVDRITIVRPDSGS